MQVRTMTEILIYLFRFLFMMQYDLQKIAPIPWQSLDAPLQEQQVCKRSYPYCNGNCIWAELVMEKKQGPKNLFSRDIDRPTDQYDKLSYIMLCNSCVALIKTGAGLQPQFSLLFFLTIASINLAVFKTQSNCFKRLYLLNRLSHRFQIGFK